MSDEKLVRDKIPELSKAKNDGGVFRTCPVDERPKFLALKLKEECYEVIAEIETNYSRRALVDELGDVITVIDSICDHYGITKEELSQAKVTKDARRGTFKEWVLWVIGTKNGW